MTQLADLKLWFIEEPTSPDDILGHAKIQKALKPYGIGVATGEHVNDSVMFKQLLQAEAIDAVQLDACVDWLASMRSSRRCYLLQSSESQWSIAVGSRNGWNCSVSHSSTIDFVVVSGKESMLEYTDHLHDAFVTPAKISSEGYHVTPTMPGYSCDGKEEEFAQFGCPWGSFWKGEKGKRMLGDKWRGVLEEQTS